MCSCLGSISREAALALSMYPFQIWWESGARKERYLMQNPHFSAPAEFLLALKPSPFRRRCNLVCHRKETAVQSPKARILRLCLEGEMHWRHQPKFPAGCASPFLNVPVLSSVTCSSPSSVYRRNPAGSCLRLPEVRQVR